MTDTPTAARVDYVDQYALRTPSGAWIMSASPQTGTPRITNDIEQAYTEKSLQDALSTKQVWDSKLREFGVPQTLSIYHRKVTVLYPEYECLEAQPATVADVDDDLF